MNATTIYLIRHGQTDWNVTNRVQGHTDVSLNEKGLSEARQLAEELKEVKFEAVYASTLTRAHVTAKQLFDTVITDSRLKETCFGKFEGLSWSEFNSKLDQNLKMRESLPLEEKMGYKLDVTVESYNEVSARAKECLDEISPRHSGQRIAVIAHGGLIKSLLSTLERKDPASYEVHNVGYVILEVKAGNYTPTHFCRITRVVK